MPKTDITIPHSLGKTEALSRLHGMLASVKENYGSQVIGHRIAQLDPHRAGFTVLMRTLPVGIAFFSTENQAAFDLIMAAASLATIPVIIIFLVFQKQIIKGIALAGLKG